MKRLIKKAGMVEVYHGTSSDKVKSILATGLKVVDGGYGDGAYVTNDINEATGYALKRAGDKKIAAVKHGFSQFDNVYPVVLVINIEEDKLTHAFQDVYYAKDGIPPSNITNVIDVSDNYAWQRLLESFTIEDPVESGLVYRDYYNAVSKYV